VADSKALAPQADFHVFVGEKAACGDVPPADRKLYLGDAYSHDPSAVLRWTSPMCPKCMTTRFRV
jgi:hypothetical protein